MQQTWTFKTYKTVFNLCTMWELPNLFSKWCSLWTNDKTQPNEDFILNIPSFHSQPDWAWKNFISSAGSLFYAALNSIVVFFYSACYFALHPDLFSLLVFSRTLMMGDHFLKSGAGCFQLLKLINFGLWK